MTLFEDNKSPYLTLVEQGSAPSNPAAGEKKLYILSSDHVLRVKDSSGSVIEISPGRILLATATPTGVGTISFASLSALFTKLIIEYAVRGTTAAASVSMDVTLNNDTTDANYRRQVVTAYGATTLAAAGGDDNVIDDAVIASTGPSGAFSMGILEIPFYALTAFNKQVRYRNMKRRDTSSVHEQINRGALEWENTAAINRVDFILAAGNFDTGSVFKVYGEY
jgi:hypothetical protein